MKYNQTQIVMRKHILFVFVLLLAGVAATAQDDSKLSYTKLLDDPYRIPNLEIELTPAWFNVSAINIATAGWKAGVKFSPFKSLQVNAGFGSTYAKKVVNGNYPGALFSDYKPFNYSFDHPKNPLFTINQDIQGIRLINAGLSFAFNDKVRTSKDKLTLNSDETNYGNMRVINSDVTYIDVQLRRRWSVGLEYFSNTNTLDLYRLGDLAISDNYYEDEDGNRFYGDGVKYSGVDYQNLSDKPNPTIDRTIPAEVGGDDYDYGYQGWITNINTKGIAIGISHEVIRNYMCDFENFGKRGNQTIRTWYADLLFASVDVDKLIFFAADTEATIYGYEMGTDTREYDLTGSGEHKIETNNVGFRIGFESRGISPTRIIKWVEQDEASRMINLGYKFEAGINPGISGKGLYMLLGIYFTFNGQV